MALLWPISSVASAQRLGTGNAPDVPIARMIIALLACLAIALSAILYLRRRSGVSLPPSLKKLLHSPSAIEIVESRRLSVQHSLCLIRHAGREYLLLLSPGASLVLREQPIAKATAKAPLA